MTRRAYGFAFLLSLMSCTALAHDLYKSSFFGKNISDLCASLKNQPITYLLIDKDGIVAEAIKNVEISVNAITLGADVVTVDTGYRLFVNRLGVYEFSSPDLKIQKIKSTCAGTIEQKISYTASTKVASSLINGKRENIPFLIEGPGESARWEGFIAADLKLLAPLIKVNEETRADFGDFLKGEASESSMEIRNAGSNPLHISSTISEQNSGRWYRIDSSNCTANPIPPLGKCSILISRLSNAIPDRKQTDVIRIKSDDKLGYPTIFINWSEIQPEVFFRRN